MMLSPIATVGQVTPRHRKHLRFADAETKLKKDTIHNNLLTGHETCKPKVRFFYYFGFSEFPELGYHN